MVLLAVASSCPVRSDPVVDDIQDSMSVEAREGDLDPGGPGVLDDVVEGFSRGSVEFVLDGLGQRGGAPRAFESDVERRGTFSYLIG